MNGLRQGIVLVAAGFILNVVFLGILFNYNIMNLEFQVYFNATASETGIPGAVSIGILNLATPMTTVVCKLVGYQIVVIAGVLMCGTSLIASTIVSQIHVLIFLHGILYGLGSNFVHIPQLHLLRHHFSGKRYNKACVAILTGIGVGIAITSLLLEKLFLVYGLQKSLRIYGACIVCIGLLASMGTRLPAKKHYESHQSISSKYSKHNDNINENPETLETTQSTVHTKSCHISPHHEYQAHSMGMELKSKHDSIEDELQIELFNTKGISVVSGEKISENMEEISDTGLNAEETTLFNVGVSTNCSHGHCVINEHIQETADNELSKVHDEQGVYQAGKKAGKIYLLKKMLKNLDFWLCQPMFFLYSLAITFSFVSLSNFMDENGMTSEEVAYTLSLMGFADLATRVLFIFVASCLPVSITVVVAIMNLALFVISVLLSFNFSNTVLKALILVMSFPRALLLALVLPVCVEIFGKQLSAEAMSVAYFLIGMGALYIHTHIYFIEEHQKVDTLRGEGCQSSEGDATPDT
ncbi:uncharacterized protein LOC117123841 [Anneissia japonica]|uniref:uncharacterized protein LOC117123841 n=1 Tax=Anneissia japonica TaxID=1529436 RepID=UPI0014256D20|nr:uncharacterized protein LOC117123841 [Anneissia japonica]